MFKNAYLKHFILLLFVVQIFLSQVFAAPWMKLGTGNTIGSSQDNGTVFWQKAYCQGGTGYINVSPDGSNKTSLNAMLSFASGDTTLAPSSFTFVSFTGANYAHQNTGGAIIVSSGNGGVYAVLTGYYLELDGYTQNSSYGYSSFFNFGYLNFVNTFGVASTTFGFRFQGSTSLADSYISPVPTFATGDYTYPYKFIPEPCVVDNNAPLGSNYSFSGGIVQRAAIDSGVVFRITEPSGVAESYAYTGGDPRTNVIEDPLTTAYTATGTTNQWGINTGSIRIVLTYTGVARNTMDQRGTGITVTKVFSGSDLMFEYLTGPGSVPVRTWDRNYLGAWVSVSGTVLSAMPEFRKETQASIIYTGVDRANPLPAILNVSGTTRNAANLFSSSLFTFNAGTSNAPTAYLAKEAGGTNVSTTSVSSTRDTDLSQQISGSHSQFHFAFTDNRAGIASGSIKVTVQVFTASNTVQSSYQTATPIFTYIYSGSDLSLFASGGAADFPDYTGFVDLVGERTLITGDRVVVNVYAEDFVGNSISQTGSFDMQDYPPKPNTFTINIQLENHLAITYDKITSVVGQYFTPSPLTTTLSAYYSGYDSLSGFTYLGLSAAELTGTNAGSTLTGVFLQNGVLTGYAHIDTGLAATKSFTFTGLAHNVYNQTGLVIININVEPGCSDAEGCGPRLMIYTGTTLIEAEANYPLTGSWYNHWFIKVKASGRPILTGNANYAILYCASSGALTTVDISNLDYPTVSNAPYAEVQTFSGSTLYVSGDNSAGLSGVIYLNNNIYIFRELTGGITYVTGKYISGTSQINWTRDLIVTGTITLTGGYITGSNAGIFAAPTIELGGGRRIYTYASTTTGFDVLIENRWNTSGTQLTGFYRTGLLTFNNSWIDRTSPVLTGSNSCQSRNTGTIVLVSQLTGYGANFTGNLTYLTGDDDAFIITAITSGTVFTSFGDNQSSGAFIYDINANSGTYVITGTITFTGNWSGYVHVQDRAGNTGYIFVETTCIQGAQVTVYAIPGYREAGNYDFTGTVSVYTLTGSPLSGTYYSSYTGSFNTAGTGLFVLPRPLYGQTIGVVLHSSMHLPAMGFTGTLTQTGINFFDFTIWTGRGQQYVTSGWFDYVDLGGIGIRSLLVPGDVLKSDNVGTGSIINSFDMAEINANLTISIATKYPPYDFDDKDGIISSFEQAVIIQNLQRQGWDLDLDKFEGLVYTGF